jgi:hypothetical protein
MASDEHEKHPDSWFAGNVEANNHNLRLTDWFFRSRAASLIWLAILLVLGYWWLNADYQKIWGSEKAGFSFGSGAGVKGFATAGVLGSATGKGGASYGHRDRSVHPGELRGRSNRRCHERGVEAARYWHVPGHSRHG